MDLYKEDIKILVTGGGGFIGSNFIRLLFSFSSFKGQVHNLDALTYAGNLQSLADVSEAFGGRYYFHKQDLADRNGLNTLIKELNPDIVLHFAAESHVDRSLYDPRDFINTNIVGTFNLLESLRSTWQDKKDVLFHMVSTDEVYGSLGDKGAFTEETAYAPRSLYSASKASGDHIARAYFHTWGIPVTVSSSGNNYGPYQFPEKLIPLMILNMLEKKELPVYGDGSNIRDWLHVEDHCRALINIMAKGSPGETYLIGAGDELSNLALVEILCELFAAKTDDSAETYKKMIKFVKDRPGHDHRYSIDSRKIRSVLGWKPNYNFKEGLAQTVDWYLTNAEWIDSVRTGEYRDWVDKHYKY